MAFEHDTPCIGRDELGQQIEQRGLACAVGAEDTDDLTFRYL
jgi:hypothetical protein